MTDVITHVNILGKAYRLKAYSSPNEARVREHGPQLEKDLNQGNITRGEYYKRFLDMILKDGAPDIDYEGEDFDAREAEAAILSFFPPSMQALVLLTGLSG